ncbi:ribonuclease III [Canibacter sp. lx-72]|nr:ribonuclease III [Canibacter zhuwentaonis]MBT1018192.1 ribonuclease III [Canibacter zhuwentaonis]MBT1035203.1 ribonuclease III [Canibacter zhuwentaonis]
MKHDLATSDGFFARFEVKVEQQLLTQALTHRSWTAEHPADKHYERLEFLGDSVLGYVVTRYIYKNHRGLNEGDLSRLRASLVSEVALASVAKRFGFGEFLRLGKGEDKNGGRERKKLLADTVESIIAAVLLSTDIEKAVNFVLYLLDEDLLSQKQFLTVENDPKTTLQERCAVGTAPVYEVVAEEGPPHNKRFTIVVKAVAVDGRGVSGTGSASSKKAAETLAAQSALSKMSTDFAHYTGYVKKHISKQASNNKTNLLTPSRSLLKPSKNSPNRCGCSE